MVTPKWKATDDLEHDETERQLLENEWLKSARRYISVTEECECDCFLCIRGEHDEHCDESNLYDKEDF